jgi:uncharacterized protein YjbJ (UPF0337 family)
MGSGTGDKAEGKVDQVKGKAREAWGDVTDDESQEAKGKAEQAKGRGKEAWGNVKEAGEDAKEGVKKALD